MDHINENLEKTLGIPATLISNPAVTELLWHALRVKDATDCEQALRRASDHVSAIERELFREPRPSAARCLDWINSAAIRLTSTMKLSSRAWLNLDRLIMQAAEAIHSLAYESREGRRENTVPHAAIKDMLAPRLETCVGRLHEILAEVRLLQQEARAELVRILEQSNLGFRQANAQ